MKRRLKHNILYFIQRIRNIEERQENAKKKKKHFYRVKYCDPICLT